MPVKLEDMMRELFTLKERAAIRCAAARIAKRHMALREQRIVEFPEHEPVVRRNVGRVRAKAKGKFA